MLNPDQVKPSSGDLLEIDQDQFSANFDRAPFLIRHRLQDHPLFTLPRLMQLARTLPEANVEYNAGTVPINADPAKTPRTGLSSEETIHRIENCSSWMALKYVDRDPEYRDLLETCLAYVKKCSPRIDATMTQPEAFIFLSSPGSITPYHMDPEHNFLLQIRGTKYMTVFDRSVVTAPELERFYSGAHRNMAFDEGFLAKSREFELVPGVGLHVPVTAPHFVRNGDGVSVSFSVTFRTPDLETRSMTHAVNGYMRRRGLNPRPVGQSAGVDAAKVASYRILRRSGNLFGRRSEG